MSDDIVHPQKGLEAGDHSRSDVPPPEVGRGPATRQGYAEKIREAYRETVKGIFRMGDLLIEAKEELPYGEFGSMIEDDLPFSKRTSRKLRAIARDQRLRDRTHASDLPPAWTTLHRLTRLNDHQWEAIEPHISPELTRSDISDLVARGAQLPLVAGEGGQAAREELEAALRELPPADRRWAKKKLQEIPTLKRVRVAQALAAADQEERDTLIELDEVKDPPRDRPEAEDLQLVLPGVASAEREELLKLDALRPRFGNGTAEGIRAALTLQSLLRWATALCARTSPESVLEGLPMMRSRRKIERDARRVADWMTAMADEIESEGEGGPDG